MKILTLFRHAKSDWKDSPVVADFDRPLSRRGQKAAPRMGALMRERGLRPDLILCSPSARTRETLILAQREAWDHAPETVFDQRLYHASAALLLQILREQQDSTGHIMLVGHNPELQSLAAQLLRADAKHGVEDLLDKFPTAALISMRFRIADWQTLQNGAGELDLFQTPKLLKAA
jgi:phosphohistidine phosphatase